MKSRCEWPSLPSQPLSRGTGAGVFTLLPVPQPQAPALLADPAGDLLAKLGALGGGDGGGAGEEPVSWGTPWGWAKLLQRAGEGCASQRWASQPFPSLTAVRHQRDIPTCQRNPKPLPTPSCSPQQSLSLPSLSLAPPTCLGMCPVLPPKPPTALCTGTSALLEIFTPIALACRAWGSPQLQLVQDPPI